MKNTVYYKCRIFYECHGNLDSVSSLLNLDKRKILKLAKNNEWEKHARPKYGDSTQRLWVFREEVSELIKSLYNEGHSFSELSILFGCSAPILSKLKKEKGWENMKKKIKKKGHKIKKISSFTIWTQNPSFGKEHLDHYGVEFNKDGTPQENYVPTVGAIKKLTELSKMKSFVDSIWEYMNPSEELLAMPIEKVGKYTQGNTKARGVDILDMYKDYRIRSRIGNMFVLTGRLNAMQPNVQQWPSDKSGSKKTVSQPKKNSIFLMKKWKNSKVEIWGSPSEKLVYLFKKGSLEQKDNPVVHKGREYSV